MKYKNRSCVLALEEVERGNGPGMDPVNGKHHQKLEKCAHRSKSMLGQGM